MKTDLSMATLIILSLIWAVIAILKPVYAYEPYEVRKATWSAPDIPQCDKELWLRIKDGCDEHE